MRLRKHAEYIAQILNLHNYYRERHDATPLRWSIRLQREATEYAMRMAASRVDDCETDEERSPIPPKLGVSWGQNFFEYFNYDGDDKTDGDADHVIEMAIDNWYNEIDDYNWRRPGVTGLSFSQLVWRGTTRVGLGVGVSRGTRGDDECIVVAAFYDPCGNFRGEFTNNVRDIKLKRELSNVQDSRMFLLQNPDLIWQRRRRPRNVGTGWRELDTFLNVVGTPRPEFYSPQDQGLKTASINAQY